MVVILTFWGSNLKPVRFDMAGTLSHHQIQEDVNTLSGDCYSLAQRKRLILLCLCLHYLLNI